MVSNITKIVTIISVVFLTACSDVKLVRMKEKSANVNINGTFCTQAPQITTAVTKFMFIIDKSGSNTTTDPMNEKRANNIERFFNGPANSPRNQNPNIEWGYIAFSGDSAKAFINSGNDNNPIFVGVPNNIPAMQTALTRQRGLDESTTPYKAALALTEKAIKTDIETHPGTAAQYVIFFMSDGLPTDYGVEGPAGEEAFRDVERLVNIAPGLISFSTAYYGPPDPAAAGGLETMAKRGRGKFIDTNTTDEFSIDDLIENNSRSDTYVVNKLLVYNVNSAICLDNTMGADSDSDGLCDRDEISTTKTDPQNRFSYGTAYSDYFHYIASLSKSGLLPCQDRSDEDRDLLTACEEALMFNSKPSGTKLTKTNVKSPDTDLDGFIDGVEYFMLHNKSAPLDNLNIFKSFDGEAVNAGEQISQHRNPLFYDAGLPTKDIYDTKADFIGYNDKGQSCYKLNQSNLKVYATKAVTDEKSLDPLLAHGEGHNVILLYFIQVLEKDPTGPGIYMSSFQTVGGLTKNTTTIDVSDKIFKAYTMPEEAP